jgi:two-component system NtrC family response regulator/two-component system response regulator AtoC
LRKACDSLKKEVVGFSPEAMHLLNGRDYPGNVRELSQMIDNAVLLADVEFILPAHMGMAPANKSPLTRQLCTLKENDEAHLVFVLKNVNGDRGRAAQILGITVRQMQRKIAAMKKNPQWESVLGDI